MTNLYVAIVPRNVTREMTSFNSTSFIELMHASSTNVVVKPMSVNLKLALLTMAFVALVENVCLCTIILSTTHLRKKVMFLFVVSLTMTQVIVVGVLLPLHCFFRHSFIYGYVTAFAIMSYTTNLSALTRDRYVAMTTPFHYREIMTKKKAGMLIAICWLTSSFVQLLPVIWGSRHNAIHKIYLSVLLVVYFILPLVYIVYVYIVILKEMWRMFRRDKNARRMWSNYHSAEDRRQSELSVTTTDCRKKSVSAATDNRRKTVVFLKYLGFRGSVSSESGLQYNTSDIALLAPLNLPIRRRRLRLFRDLQMFLVFTMIFLTYAMTWFPVMYLTMLGVIDRPDLAPKSLSASSIFFIAFNALVDPIIYGIGLKEVRRLIVKSISKTRC